MMIKLVMILISGVNVGVPYIFKQRAYDTLLSKYYEIDLTSIRRKRSYELLGLSVFGLWVPSHLTLIWCLVSLALSFRSELKFMSLEKKLRDQLNYEFPIWIRIVQSNLQNNTVYNALLMSKQHAFTLLLPSIDILLECIEKNPNNIQNYQDFMKDFNSFEIRKMMMHLYRYNFVGVNESMDQLQMQIKASNRWIEETRSDLFNKQREWYKWLSAVPMLSVTFLFIILMFQVMISVMEGGWML